MKKIFFAVLFFVPLLCSGQPGIITSIAGGSAAGFAGDSGLAVHASLFEPTSIVFDSAQNMYIADQNNSRIRKINGATGFIYTIAGTDSVGYNGDGISARNAWLNYPDAVCLDKSGNILIADQLNYRVRKISSLTGTISTIAGTGIAGYTGDGGQATNAKIGAITGLCADDTGNIYIADYDNRVLRKLSAASGLVTTIFSSLVIIGVTADHSGNLYIDCSNVIVKYNTATGANSIVAGIPAYVGSSGDGRPATSAIIESWGVFVDTGNNVFLTDISGHTIREVLSSNGIIYNVAGNDTGGYAGDGGQAIHAELSIATSICLDQLGNVYFADEANNCIRKIVAPLLACPKPAGSFTHTGSGYTWSFLYTGSPLYLDSLVFMPGDGNTIAGAPGYLLPYTYGAPGNYSACVIAYSPCGNDTVCSNLAVATAIPNVEPAEYLELFPDPAESTVNLVSTGLITNVRISDASGRIAYTHDYYAQSVKIDVSDLSPGLYFIRVNGAATRKFVKQ